MYKCTRESIERHLIKTEPETNQGTNVRHESVDINLLNYGERLLLSFARRVQFVRLGDRFVYSSEVSSVYF